MENVYGNSENENVLGAKKNGEWKKRNVSNDKKGR